ncbi:MAG: hypothetical protein R3C59_31595 [Planctomycetaceae bacterium]
MSFHSESNSPPLALRLLCALLLLIVLIGTSGCSIFVMAGKAIFGDPKVQSPFTAATGKKLTDSDESVVIICDAPHRILSSFPSVQIDLLDRVSRDLETQGINVVPSGDVARWYDDHGEWGDFSELAKEFEAGYVLHIDLRKFDHRVPESETLMQGKAEGHISVYHVNNGRSTKLSPALTEYSSPGTVVFDRDFKVEFPTTYPVARESRSEDQFVQEFMDRTALHLSQHLYDYRMSESIH